MSSTTTPCEMMLDSEALRSKMNKLKHTHELIGDRFEVSRTVLGRLRGLSWTGLDLESIEAQLQILDQLWSEAAQFNTPNQKEGQSRKEYELQLLLTTKRDLAVANFLEKQLHKKVGLLNTHLIRASDQAARDRLRQSSASTTSQ